MCLTGYKASGSMGVAYEAHQIVIEKIHKERSVKNLVNVKKLKGKIAENELTYGEISEILNISPNTLRRRFETAIFPSNEITVLTRVLNLNADELLGIFFTDDVTY